MKTLWRCLVILVLWPIWYPLALVFLVAVLAGGGTSNHSRIQLWRHCCYLAMVVLGARDTE